MPKLVVGTFLTVDGVMQAPGGPDEDREGGFEHGGWSVNYWDDVMGQLIVESTLQGDVLLLGRKTYEIFAAHWPNVGGDDPRPHFVDRNAVLGQARCKQPGRHRQSRFAHAVLASIH